MTVTHVVGIDPGLVHTGVVELIFSSDHRVIQVEHEAIAGADAQAVVDFITQPKAAAVHSDLWGGDEPHIFIEKYQPRSHLGTDAAMAKAVHDLQAALPKAKVLLNTGVKKVVRRPLMELLGCWSFTTVTHHQDLRSAARIAVLGMLKDAEMNRLIADVVRDELKGESWNVRS